MLEQNCSLSHVEKGVARALEQYEDKIAVKVMHIKEKGVARALEYAVTLYPTFYTELL